MQRLLLPVLLLGACADPVAKYAPDDPERRDSGTVDTADSGGGNDSADSGADTAADTSDTATDTADTGPDTATSEVLVPGSAWCAAGRTVTGGGYTGTFCLAPVDLAAGTVATGGGYTWQPGPVVLLPR